MVLSKVIKEHITRNGENKIYTVSDFADLNNDMLVTRVLSRLKEEQFLIRLSQGIYLYPRRNRFGICKPSIDQIANAIAEKDHASIIPSGLTALNELGLSTQVSMNAVFITNGTPRTIKLGNRSITFKKGTPRYFAYQSLIFTMVVTALKEIGEEKVTDENLQKIKSILDKEEKEKVNHDYKIAPQWIRKKLKTVLYGNNWEDNMDKEDIKLFNRISFERKEEIRRFTFEWVYYELMDKQEDEGKKKDLGFLLNKAIDYLDEIGLTTADKFKTEISDTLKRMIEKEKK